MLIKEYKKNVELLKKWAYAYYVEDNPIATDEEYDKLYKKIEEFEKNNPKEIIIDSPTQRIGEILDKFSKSSHIEPMFSMDNIFNNEELIKWVKTKNEFLCEPKFDGASLNLLYEDGVLVKATTRGDGKKGEVITNNAKTIQSIPLKISYKKRIEIRGEVVINKKDFISINRQREENNQELFVNARNTASGSLRKLDPLLTAKRKLFFYPWGVGANSLEFKTFSKLMNFIYDLGFKKPPFFELCNFENIEKNYSKLLFLRDKIDVEMDGMVIKVDNLALQKELGFTSKFPKWAVAYKFPAIEKVTKIEAITLQVGRTGVITPVAELKPIEVAGATISRTTLHNFDEIESKDIRINDSVIVVRSGDVIPKITKVLKDRREGKEQKVLRPKNCPTCKSTLLDEGKIIKCQNLQCQDRIVGAIEYFASKGCMNIDGLGKAIVQKLVEEKLISNIYDLYFLKYEELEELENFKEKSINNLLNSIENSKNVECWRFIKSLGIEHFGDEGSKLICNHIGIDKLIIPKELLVGLDGIGKEVSFSYENFMRINFEFVKKLIEIIKPQKTPLINGINKIKIIETLFKFEKAGTKTFQELFNYFGFENFREIDKNNKINLPIKKIEDFNIKFKEQENRYKEILEILKNQEIKKEENENKKSIFSNKTVVLTGTMSKPREEIVKILEDKGAKISKSISKKTDFLIYGEKAGSKLSKAKELGVKTLSEKEI